MNTRSRVYFSFNYTINANKKEMTESAILASIMSKSSRKYNSQKQIEKYLGNLYNTLFDVNVEKIGDLYNIEFKLECINKKYLPDNIDVVSDALKFLYDMIYDQSIKNGRFDENLVNREKEYIKDKIKEQKDEKLKYGILKMEQILSKDEPFATSVFGDENQIDKITSNDIYNRYINVLNDSCINILISGNLDGYDNIEEIVKNIFNEKINSSVNAKDLVYDKHIDDSNKKDINETYETQQTTQSVITFGMRIRNSTTDDFFALNVYNAILGSTPSSKLFQNFREKESLAYTVRSRYYRFKSIIIIYAGIQKKNYEKAKEVVEKQIKDMEDGNITDIEFNAAKDSLVSDLVEWNDSKMSLAKMLFVNAFTNTNYTLNEMIEKIQKVSLQDVINVAKKITLEEIYLLGGEADV